MQRRSIEAKSEQLRPKPKKDFGFKEIARRVLRNPVVAPMLLATAIGLGSVQRSEAQDTVPTEPAPALEFAVAGVNGANLRGGASTSAEVRQTLSAGTELEVRDVADPDGSQYDWMQVVSIDGQLVSGDLFVAREVLTDVQIVAEPTADAATQPAETAAPQLEITPRMTATEAFVTQQAEVQGFSEMNQAWLSNAEVGPFTGLPPVFLYQSQEMTELPGNIGEFQLNSNIIYTLTYGGVDYELNGAQAIQLSLMQAIAAAAGEIHSAEDFQNWMAQFAAGEVGTGEVVGHDWETGERRPFEFDAHQPITIIMRGAFPEAELGRDTDPLGFKSTQWGIFNHTANENGGLVIEIFLDSDDMRDMQGRVNDDPRNVTWWYGKAFNTAVMSLPATPDPLDSQKGLDLNDIIRPYNSEYSMSADYNTASDYLDNHDAGGEASWERFLLIFQERPYFQASDPDHTRDPFRLNR